MNSRYYTKEIFGKGSEAAEREYELTQFFCLINFLGGLFVLCDGGDFFPLGLAPVVLFLLISITTYKLDYKGCVQVER